MGYGVHINSALVSAQNRKRIYWTNIRVKEVGLFGELHSDIPQPEDRGILLKDILEDEVDEKYYISKRQLERLDIGNIKIAGQISFKSKGVENDKATALLSRDYKGISGHQGFNVCVAGGNQHPKTVSNARIRRLTPLECERLQTMKPNYTAVVSDSQRYKMIGNGWTIDVIAHIFSFINDGKT